MKIYVVDDDKPALEALAFMLRAHGFEVEAFESAEAFLRTNLGNSTWILVSDVTMPGMGGIDLLKHLRAQGHTERVILMTGSADHQVVAESVTSDAQAVLEKPFDAVTLLTMLQG